MEKFVVPFVTILIGVPAIPIAGGEYIEKDEPGPFQ
jgi:hypothetical protein